MNSNVRSYNPQTDYAGVKALYQNSSLYGGQFDLARDAPEKLEQIKDKILVAENNEEKIVGTVTLFADRRAAWLYRFAVIQENEEEIAQQLYNSAVKLAKKFGHSQLLVYAPSGDKHFEKRYTQMGLNKGGDYTCYWNDI